MSRGCRNREGVDQRTQTHRRCMRSGDLKHRPAEIANHTVLKTSMLLRDKVLSVPTTDEMIKLCDVMGTHLCCGGSHIAKAMMVAILHHIIATKQHIDTLNLNRVICPLFLTFKNTHDESMKDGPTCFKAAESR